MGSETPEKEKLIDDGMGEDINVKYEKVEEEKDIGLNDIDSNSLADESNQAKQSMTCCNELAEERILKFVDLITLNCCALKEKEMEADQDIDNGKWYPCGTNKKGSNVGGSKWYQCCSAKEKEFDVEYKQILEEA